MYSRYSSERSDKQLRIPDHYSGCAFSPSAPSDSAPRAFGVAKPTPLSAEPEPPKHPPTADADVAELPPPSPLPTDAPARQEHSVSHAPSPLPLLANGLDFDQLLILGLILLLSHSGKDSDIVRWLGLLLFCG